MNARVRDALGNDETARDYNKARTGSRERPTVLLILQVSELDNVMVAPPLVSEARESIQQIRRDTGMAVLIVEQKVREVLKTAGRVYVLRNGLVSFTGPTEELRDEAKLREVSLERQTPA